MCNACACSVVYAAGGLRPVKGTTGKFYLKTSGENDCAHENGLFYNNILYVVVLYERIRHVKTIYYFNVKKKKTRVGGERGAERVGRVERNLYSCPVIQQ